MQTKRGRTGNCFAACVASILEVSIETLPDHFKHGASGVEPRWLNEWNDYLKPFGLGIIWADAMFSRAPSGYAIAEMIVAGNKWNHAVVCLDGEPVHDPLGQGYKFERCLNWYVFTALQPERFVRDEFKEIRTQMDKLVDCDFVCSRCGSQKPA